MIIDVIALLLLVIAIFKGSSRGLIVAVFSFLGFIIGLAAALKLSTAVAAYIGDNTTISQRWLPVIAFIVVFVIILLLVRLGARLVEKAIRIVMLGWLNKLGGIIFYILIYFFIFSIILFYAVQLHIIKPEVTSASSTYKYIQPIAPKMMSIIGHILPFFKDMFQDLLNFFQNISDKHR